MTISTENMTRIRELFPRWSKANGSRSMNETLERKLGFLDQAQLAIAIQDHRASHPFDGFEIDDVLQRCRGMRTTAPAPMTSSEQASSRVTWLRLVLELRVADPARLDRARRLAMFERQDGRDVDDDDPERWPDSMLAIVGRAIERNLIPEPPAARPRASGQCPKGEEFAKQVASGSDRRGERHNCIECGRRWRGLGRCPGCLKIAAQVWRAKYGSAAQKYLDEQAAGLGAIERRTSEPGTLGVDEAADLIAQRRAGT